MFRLFYPLLDLVANDEVVDSQTEPAGAEYDNSNNQFPEKTDVFLKYVEYAPDSANCTKKPKNHNDNFLLCCE